jgi:hypothetical protein
MARFNLLLRAQNGIWVNFCGLTMMLKNSSMQKPFSDLLIYFIKRRILHQITNLVTKTTFFAHGGISKKSL